MVWLGDHQDVEGGASVSGQGMGTTRVRRLADAVVGTDGSGWLGGVLGANGTTVGGGSGLLQGDAPFPDNGNVVTPTCVSFVDPQGTVGAKVLFNLAYGLPTLAFLVFLTMRLKPALRRLQRSQSQIMRTYYSFLWVVCGLNLFRCIFQIAESTNGSTERDIKSWSFVWLVTTAGMTVMEVSVVTFLSQGYIATGKEALIRTLGISGAVAFLDSIVKMILIFGCGTSLFIVKEPNGDDSTSDPLGWLQLDMSWVKWGFWTAHHILYCMVYGFILVLPHTALRDYLPARPSFYRYVALLCANNFGLVVGSMMIGSKDVSGYCVYGVFAYLYSVCYPPLLYMTFLSEFFVDDDLELEHQYYSEMREAGYFDDIDFQQ